eukprot:scaffold34480_cov44-Phaeocystis_antarctica.AAC.1
MNCRVASLRCCASSPVATRAAIPWSCAMCWWAAAPVRVRIRVRVRVRRCGAWLRLLGALQLEQLGLQLAQRELLTPPLAREPVEYAGLLPGQVRCCGHVGRDGRGGGAARREGQLLVGVRVGVGVGVGVGVESRAQARAPGLGLGVGVRVRARVRREGQRHPIDCDAIGEQAHLGGCG